MADQTDPPAPSTPQPRRGWLEIVREPETAEAVAFCPYRGRILRVGDCFACPDCDGLAMDSRGKHSYVVCTRAESDGIATTACAASAPLEDTEAWSVRVLAGVPADDSDEG